MTTEEKKLLVKYVALTIPFNALTRDFDRQDLFDSNTFYPSRDLMVVIEVFLATHKPEQLLSQSPNSDAEANALLQEFTDSAEYKQASQEILKEFKN